MTTFLKTQEAATTFKNFLSVLEIFDQVRKSFTDKYLIFMQQVLIMIQEHLNP